MDIQWLLQRLPPVEEIRPDLRRSEPDMYGASHLIAYQLRMGDPPKSCATWLHGWAYGPITHVRQINHWGRENDAHLVATEGQAQFLREHGFKSITAVGMPFIYGDHVKVRRHPGTLLVMPAHSLPYTDHHWAMEDYACQIARLKDHFACIVACVSPSCVAKGYWTSAFECHGIPWIEGAAQWDKNALLRMNCLFKSCEFVTTNTIGSHVAYAAHSGCKVSIYGPFAAIKEEDYKDDPFYKQYPKVLKANIEKAQESFLRSIYPHLFVAPWEATQSLAWGREMVGAPYRKSPAMLSRLLGWPQRNFVRASLGRIKRKAIALLRSDRMGAVK